jgi:hypothetical protein
MVVWGGKRKKENSKDGRKEGNSMPPHRDFSSGFVLSLNCHASFS